MPIDQLSPEDAHVIPSAMLAPLTRMGERLAGLEARATVEIAALKQDTQVIRSSMHDTNNNMQLFVAAERQCASSLATLSVQMQTHTEALTSLAKQVTDLHIARSQAQGAWWATGKIALILATCLSGIAAAITFVLSLAPHLIR
jgi:hypothetical protein